MSVIGRPKDPVYSPSAPPEGKDELRRWLYDEVLLIHRAIDALRVSNATRNYPKWIVDSFPGYDLHTGVTPSATTANGISMLGFDDTYSSTDAASLIHVLPHGWAHETSIGPRIHTLNLNSIAGDVQWAMEYQWANADGTAGAVATLSAVQTFQGTANKAEVVSFPKIAGDGFAGLNSIFMCRVYRLGGSVNDTATGTIALTAFGISLQVDADGSRQENTK